MIDTRCGLRCEGGVLTGTIRRERESSNAKSGQRAKREVSTGWIGKK